MLNTVTVKGVTIGEGIPKVCVPITGETKEQLVEEAVFLKTLDLDLVEWRVDFFEGLEQIKLVKAALKEIRAILKNTPLIFTLRTLKEGGKKGISKEYYFELNQAMIETGEIDIIDIELFSGDNEIKRLIDFAHANGVCVILSNHEFTETPSKEEIINRLCKEQDLGADILKIAVMPNNAANVITLLDATNAMKEQYAKQPMVTISMAGKGIISRLAGELFGSSMTFGAAERASAPGQIAASELRHILSILHQNC